jgi:hexosaminidase
MADLNLIPLPRTVRQSEGRCSRLGDFAALPGTSLVAELTRVAANAGLSLELRLDPSLAGGPESYRLSVTPDGISITGGSAAGVFYGAQTLRQLGPDYPCVEIGDTPRFGWRGALVDVGRHFMPIEALYQFVDALALYKFNVLHLHLTEDQGWRIEIKKYPRLTEVGSMRSETMLGNEVKDGFDGKPHGGFYTQDELRALVAYAAERFVTIMPEVELPGHSQAAIAAYPELGCTGEQLAVRNPWGVSENIYNPSDATLQFLRDVFDEVLDIFPSTFIHIGGDEAPKAQWKTSPIAQARIKEQGLKDEDELQSWFIGQMERYLASKGRRLVGWDEILEGGLPAGATVMSWRGEGGGIEAAKSGHDVIMSPGEYVYLDHYQSAKKASEPRAIGGCTTLRRVYDYEPIPAALTATEAKHVLGAQGQLWTEYIPTPAQLEYMAFPRLCALAEVLWLPAEQKDFDSFWERLEGDLPRLAVRGVNFRKLDEEQKTVCKESK